MQSIRGKIKLAKNSLLTSIKLFNNNANAYNNLGNIYSELNQLQEAATAYKRAIDITPSDPSAYHNLGDLWLSQQHSADLALPYISKALELSPDFIPSRLNMGVINMLLGNDEKAIYAFNQCLDLNPDLISAHGNLARIYIRANNHQQALFHINTMLNIQPGNKDATSLLHQINR
jgi:tetratricopeptide (TPR) repeat protein